VSTKFVQIKVPGLKLALPGGLYTGEQFHGHHGPLIVFIIIQTMLKIVKIFLKVFIFNPP
jgi:hypothetical protein